MISEVRAKAHLRILRYKLAIATLYNCGIHLWKVGIEDPVLYKAEVSDPTRSQGKLTLSLKGPYHVVEVGQDKMYNLKTT